MSTTRILQFTGADLRVTKLGVSSNVEVGTANLVVDTQTGRVGVGKTDPAFSMDVDGIVNTTALYVGGSNVFYDGTLVLSNATTGATSNLFITDVSGYGYDDETKILSSNAATNDLFGYSVAISGDYAIVGAHRKGGYTGFAYIYERTGDNAWGTVVEIKADDGAANDYFGISVAISGDYAIVGAPYDDDNSATDSGSAYIFERGQGGTWPQTQTQKLTAGTGAAADDYFGQSVAISGDYAIVGAWADDDNSASGSGSAYIFERGLGGTWSQTQKLTAGDPATADYFGYSVAISGDYAIVGAYRKDSYKGAAYIFRRDQNGTWSETQKLTAGTDAGTDDVFGYSVAISGDYAIVGAYGNDDNNAAQSGSAYIFERGQGGTWFQTQKLTAGDPYHNDNFGLSVAISGDYAIVGANGDDDNSATDSGSAYIFRRASVGQTWSQTQKLTAGTDAAQGDYFGYSVAISGDYVIVGAPYDDDNSLNNSGSAYIYAKLPQPGLSVSTPIQAAGSLLSFTGQHICFPEGPMSQGLVVSANKNKYLTLNGPLTTGQRAIKSSESLPVVSLSDVANDRSAFGVVDRLETAAGTTRIQKSGIGKVVQNKEFGDNRVIVNALGEGAMWVVNTNGNLVSGDYITTSNVAGYGQRQDDDLLHNYTVAKITMDCDFTPEDLPVQVIKKDEDGKNVLDAYGRIQWEDTERTEKAYRIRYLTTDGRGTDEANCVHRAAYVGCTYHCG